MMPSVLLKRKRVDQLGQIAFGEGRMESQSSFKALFTIKRRGVDYLGQVKIDLLKENLDLEVFNTLYWEEFDLEPERLEQTLKKQLMVKIGMERNMSDSVKSFASKFVIDDKSEYEESQDEVIPDEEDDDLNVIFSRLNDTYFQGKLDVCIEWGKDSASLNRRSIRFGSFDARKNKIRIHPRLNQEFVPLYVLEYTVYHEMCHKWLPPIKKNKQWSTHHPEFKKKEREYKESKKAQQWEKKNWVKLLAPISQES